MKLNLKEEPDILRFYAIRVINHHGNRYRVVFQRSLLVNL
jgi:hypothetical protein